MFDPRLSLAIVLAAGTLVAPPMSARAQDEPEGGEGASSQPKITASTFSAFRARPIGPALASGRIGDFAINPHDPSEHYVAVASGGVWKTDNNGITYRPIFDTQGSYSIGCVTLDPSNPSVVWVGTGENNSQRSVSWGDGVYRSLDGGRSWKNMGLKGSEHIGNIAIDPRDSSRVFVAAQGPLWNSGGERGLYLSEDGGGSWERVLHVDDDTGVNEVFFHPGDPGVMYASTYQRRRHVWTLVDGGPGSGIHKSTDGGRTWRKLSRGLPAGEKGRIGLAVTPASPDRVYAIIEATEASERGVYRSDDRGETWRRTSGFMTSSPQYYNELVASPHDGDVVYALDTRTMISRDGGATFTPIGGTNRHVDDHALWIDPKDPEHLIIGGDGGIYDTYDGGSNWRYVANLPITQFYRVSVDEALPFYNVYGGTQDNNSQGGPSRTTDAIGIANSDWFITVGGDGYETVVDPTDHHVIYAQYQYGGLVRYDHRSGEALDIRPQQRPDEEPYVFNWDTPIIISPHSHTRIYFAGNFLFRSDDRGESWEVVSPNLTRGIDRNELEVFGERMKPEAVALHDSTSIYGNAVSLSESPVEEGLIYVGTDDGLIHVTENAGRTWRTIKSEDIRGVPENCYVSNLTASDTDPGVVYASFDNHKNGDFKPYLYRSDNRGRTWRSIAGDLPENNVCYTLRQDHENEDLLFLGTEYGAYFTLDGGEKWLKLSGLPTIAVRDIEIQRRENDLVLGTFGRGFYVVDDYAPMREIDAQTLQREAALFDVKDAPLYVPRSRLGGGTGKGSQGATLWSAENPPFGAVFTYAIGAEFPTLKQERLKAQKSDGWAFPTVEEQRDEERERAPTVFLTVRNEDGDVVRRIEANKSKGVHRTAWDLRHASTNPAGSAGSQFDWSTAPGGHLAAPGTYTVTIELERDGRFSPLAGPESFEVVLLDQATFPAPDQAELLAFRTRAAELNRAVQGAIRVAGEAQDRLQRLHQAIAQTPRADEDHLDQIDDLRERLDDLLIELTGDRVIASRDEAVPLSIRDRVAYATGSQADSTSAPTGTQLEQYGYAADAFERLLPRLRTLVERDLVELERDLESLGAPWTPGRVPNWRRER